MNDLRSMTDDQLSVALKEAGRNLEVSQRLYAHSHGYLRKEIVRDQARYVLLVIERQRRAAFSFGLVA